MVRMRTALGITRRWDHSERKKRIQKQRRKLLHFSPKYPEIWLYNHFFFYNSSFLLVKTSSTSLILFFSLYQFSQLLTGLPSLVNHTRDFLGGVAAVAAAEAESAVPAGWRGSGLEGEIVF